jgi:hypothetical protein
MWQANSSKNVGVDKNATVTHTPEISFLYPDLPENVQEMKIFHPFQSFMT